jgi:polyisoprenoid-binding protein YceI
MKTRILQAMAICVMTSTSAFAAPNTWKLDLEKSSVNFKGKFLGNIAEASMKFKSGSLTEKKEGIKGGTLVGDMASITSNSGLDDQVKGPMFLDVKKYPTATLKITEFTELKTFAPGPNARIKGILTFKGKNKKIEQESTVKKAEDGTLHAEGSFKTLTDKTVEGEVSYQLWFKK